MRLDLGTARGERRTKSVRTARLTLGLFRSVSGEILDLSVSGAKVRLSRPVAKLPKVFSIEIDGTGVARKHDAVCRWQDGEVIGVEFKY